MIFFSIYQSVFYLSERDRDREIETERELFEKFLRIVRANKSAMCSAGQQAGNPSRS